MQLVDYLSIYAGIATFILAFLAVAVTLKPPTEMKTKIVWWFLFGFLSITPIGALIYQVKISSDQRLKDAETHNKEVYDNSTQQGILNQKMSYLQGQNSAMIALLSKSDSHDFDKQLIGAFNKFSNGLDEKAKSEKSKTQPVFTLKTRALNLSNEIITFLNERKKGIPPDPTSSSNWEKQMEAIDIYQNETYYLCNVKFGNDIAQIHEEMSEKNLKTQDLDSYCNLHVFFIIESVAYDIRNLAAKLPN